MEKVATYQRFYTDQKNRLFSYLFFRCGDREVARDITQESFTRHFKQYGTAQKTLIPSLLFTIARNALVDYQRNRYKQNTLNPPQVVIPDEESTFIRKEEHSRILQAMGKLSEQDREILTLAVGGMAYKEIGALLDLSIANVKVRVHRARKTLQELLSDKVI
ncbi:RNA polymerase sigma factor [Desulfogranum marinum]|uniref:RNA polymerase sigma factor n=1 Tax=Desulfogranum marinum TaxID=453220 RepID=UPI0019646A4A|nr:RNA polymerase sigma factor [Desulfogranum marinum]